jgi:hypothetical protein
MTAKSPRGPPLCSVPKVLGPTPPFLTELIHPHLKDKGNTGPPGETSSPTGTTNMHTGQPQDA